MRRFLSVVKWVGGIGLIVVLVCGGGMAFLYPTLSKTLKEQRERAMGPIVEVKTVEKGDLTRTISAPGTVKPKTEANITSRVSATIIRLPFEEGDTVKVGDVLVELDSKEVKAELAAAEARLLAQRASLKSAEASLAAEEAAILGTKASLDKALADWERQQELFGSGDISKAELDVYRATLDEQRASYEARLAGLKGSEANVEAARAAVLQSEADVARAKENVEYTIIRSPMNGVITRVDAKVGEVALGTITNAGSVIMIIADLSEMLVEARLSERDVARAKEGMGAKVYINGFPDRTFRGTLRRVSIQSQRGEDGATFFEAEIVLHLDGDRSMFAGLTANVDIEVENLEEVVVVPSQAVLDKRVEDLPEKVRSTSQVVDKDRTFASVVFVLDDRKVVMRPVRVAASSLTSTAISEGLEPGEKVVVGPYRALRELEDAKTVRLPEDEKKEDEGRPGETEVAKDGGETGAGEDDKPAQSEEKASSPEAAEEESTAGEAHASTAG